MEQKRKVKSLISTPETSELGFLSKLLIVLSCFFCFWALFLIIFSVSFVRADEEKIFSYTGFDEKREVIYNLGFVRSGNLSKIISTMKVDDGGGIDKLYVTPVPVVVYDSYNQPIGRFTSRYYVNLLGGKDIIITGSDNISIIGGQDLRVVTGNSDVTIFGGRNNKINLTNSRSYNVIIGGQGNTVRGINGAILGGSGNEITGRDSFILGGENNKVSSNNAIVAGYKVGASKDNIFVFSNDNEGFVPQKSNTFYINVQKGLGINMGNNAGGVVVNGAVKFGNLGNCSNDGLIGLSSDSLHGCGDGGLKELGNVDDSWITRDGFEGYCTGNDYLKISAEEERYRQCGSEEDYKNVVFETKLLTGLDNDCGGDISQGKNPCVFVCTGGYHYFQGSGDCKKDCKIPWSAVEYTGHGKTIVGFTASSSTCNKEGLACNSVRVKLKCVDGEWKKISGDGSWNDTTELFQTCGSSPNDSCDKRVYQYTNKISENWIESPDSCNDYKVEKGRCTSVSYFRGSCYTNHTLQAVNGGNCETGVDTSGCGCVPNTKIGKCSWKDKKEIKNTILLSTGFKQTASGKNGIFKPKSKYYVYYTESDECTYKCDTGYEYVVGKPSLKTNTGCWTGCVRPWDDEIVKYGFIINGVEENNICKPVRMICGEEGKWEAYNYWMGFRKDPIDIYDTEGNIIYNIKFDNSKCEGKN